MKKLISLILAITILCSVSAALAEARQIDGLSDRKIKIHEAGLNATADEMLAQGISPTTGRNLDEVSLNVPDGFLGAAMTGKYLPVMVQVSNSSNGFNSAENIATGGDVYKTAPINGEYADIVYECVQASNGSLSRMTMIFSDVLPDYVGFIRSTRYTHVRLRQEWGALFLTSGYSEYVTDEWTKYGVPNPMGNKRAEDPGPVYVGGVGDNKPWRKYYGYLTGISDSNNKLFMLVGPGDDENLKGLVADPKTVPENKFEFPNHTWLFTDELPDGGDSGEIIYVTYGHIYQTDSRLEYDEDSNGYIRYVNVPTIGDQAYCGSRLVGKPTVVTVNGKNDMRKVTAERVAGDPIIFSNVIIQGIEMKWPGGEIPDPQLVGSGNADYFMGGQHYEGVWQRKDINSRTVYYDKDGNEIQLQRGRTLIILMNYNNKTSNVKYE